MNPVAVPVPPLAPRGEAEVRVEILPLRRGILRFTGVTLARPDPLGLFRAFSRISAPQTVLILPKRYPLPPIALPGTMKYQQGGVALAANVGRSEEFVSLRDYRHGDPLRHIHWRSWAKAGKPIVKEFEDEFFVRHALVLDTFTDEPHSEMLEEAVSVAASFACTVLTQESLLDLLFVGAESYCFTAGRGLAHADQMLEILASVRACARQAVCDARTPRPRPRLRRERLHLRVAAMGRRAEKLRGKTARAARAGAGVRHCATGQSETWMPAPCAPSRKTFMFSKREKSRNNSRGCHDVKTRPRRKRAPSKRRRFCCWRSCSFGAGNRACCLPARSWASFSKARGSSKRAGNCRTPISAAS